MSRMGEFSILKEAFASTGKDTDIGEVLLHGDASRLGLMVKTDGVDLDLFHIEAKASKDGEYTTYVDDWDSTPSSPVKFHLEDINALGDGVTALAVIDVAGIWAIRFAASVAAGSTDLSVEGIWSNFGDDQAVVQNLIRGESAVRRSGQSGATLMDGTEQTLYESASDVDFEFGGGVVHIPASAGAAASLKVYTKIKSGGSYLDVTPANIGAYSGTAITYLLGQTGDNASNTRRAYIPRFNKFGLKVTLQQGTEGAGYASVDSEWWDSLG